MKRILTATMLAMSVTAFAQQPAQPSPQEQLEQANARLAVLARQRDEAMNRLVIVEAEAARLAGELEKLRAEVAKAKADTKK